MKKIVTLVGLAVLVVTPAFAANAKKKMQVQQGYYQQDSHWRNSRNSANVYSYTGRFIGRDPSPNVRQRLRDDDMRFRNTF